MRNAPPVESAPALAQDITPRARPDTDIAIPVLTLVLIAILTAIFWQELAWATDFSAPRMPSRPALLVLGGIDSQLLFGAGEWWRLFTAPLLHAGLSHLIGNCVVLGLIGFFLEPLVGWAWFGAIFAIAALGGDLGSLGQGQSNLLSVGASGAITGLLAAALLCAGRMGNEARRARMRKWSARVLIYATLPAYLSASAVSGHTDYGAHVGGALFGGLAGLLVTLTWDPRNGKPSFEFFAMAIGGAFALMAAAGFVMAASQSGVHKAQNAYLIPGAEMPGNNKDAMAHSAELVARYPADPRGHYFRGLYLAQQKDLPSAAEELRKALAAEQAHPETFSDSFDQMVRMTLALVIRAEGDADAARAMAKDACAQSPRGSELLQILQQAKICD